MTQSRPGETHGSGAQDGDASGVQGLDFIGSEERQAMGAQARWPQHDCPPRIWGSLLLLLYGALFLVSCNTGGDTGTPPEVPPAADPQFVRQGAMEVLKLYRTALLQK